MPKHILARHLVTALCAAPAFIALLCFDAFAQVDELARVKCVQFGYKPDTPAHEECVKQYARASASGPVSQAPPRATPLPTRTPPANSPAPTAEVREDKFWDEVRALGNEEAFEAYLERYPAGRYARLAKVHLARIREANERASAEREASEWASAKAKGTEHAYLYYLGLFPTGLHRGEAESALTRLRELAQEETRWKEAEQEKTRSAYEAYLAAYPQGRYVGITNQRLATIARAGLQAGLVFSDCVGCPNMVVIPAGRFSMGSANPRPADWDELPRHFVSVRSFALGQVEVTQAEWVEIMGFMGFEGARHPNRSGYPVDKVSWGEAQEFLRRLSVRTGKTYRLPSEAEWEYAARAGGEDTFAFGDSRAQLANHAWYSANSNGLPRPVAGKLPNAFGLYDMLGNVREWVADCWHDNYVGAPIDGTAWGGQCALRVVRGGSAAEDVMQVRPTVRGFSIIGVATRDGAPIGIRVARDIN